MKKKALILVILTMLGFAAYYYVHIRQEKKDNNFLTVYGNVDIREVNLGFRVPGLIKAMKLEEGDLVKKGQIIAYIDMNQYIDQLNEANAQTNTQKAELNKLLAGTRSEEIAQAKAFVQEREATLANARILLERNQKGYKIGIVSKQEYDNSVKLNDESVSRLSAAKEALLQAVNGPRKEDIQAAQASLNSVQAKASGLRRTISYTVLTSPSDGTVLTRIKEPGSYVGSGEVIYTLALNSPKWIQAYVDETNLGKIRPGMAAQIITDSYPDKTFTGTIGFISPTAEFTPKSVETTELRSSLVYRLRIILKDPQNQLRQGMPVTVKLKIGMDKNAKAANKNR